MKVSADKITPKITALGEAVAACTDRSTPEVVAAAATVAQRATQRVSLSGDYTVVALAGSTGSGKSSMFNALTETELAEQAVRRPTTSRAMAVGWGTDLPNDLLDWLDVGRRHLIASDDPGLANLVLVDLPDHDSTEAEHRITVDRMVETVDALIWVVDPQKYADSALHDGYLKPLADHADVMMVVLNQIDRLTPEQVKGCVADLRRLLDSEGLRSTPLMAVSALRGDGVVALREALKATVRRKQTMLRRIALDVRKSAKALASDLGPKAPGKINGSLKDYVAETLGEAAGVPLVTDGVEQSWRRRGTAATGWPLVSWVSRLRPDPLKKLHLDATAALESSPTTVNRTSLPNPTAVQSAKVEQGLRQLVDQAAQGMPPGWVHAVDAAAHRDQALLRDDLDTAIASTDLKVHSGAWWWTLITVLQWVFIAAVVVGVGWWLAGPALAASGFGIPIVSWAGVPAGVWIAVSAVLAGVALALVSKALVAWGAKARAKAAQDVLQAAILGVVEEQVFAPVQAELDRYHRAREALRTAVR